MSTNDKGQKIKGDINAVPAENTINDGFGDINASNLLRGKGVEILPQLANPGNSSSVWINVGDGHLYRGNVDIESGVSPNTLQQTYDASLSGASILTNPAIGGLILRDAPTPYGSIFSITSSDMATTYLSVTNLGLGIDTITALNGSDISFDGADLIDVGTINGIDTSDIVTGPASSIDGIIPIFDGITGKALRASGLSYDSTTFGLFGFSELVPLNVSLVVDTSVLSTKVSGDAMNRVSITNSSIKLGNGSDQPITLTGGIDKMVAATSTDYAVIEAGSYRSLSDSYGTHFSANGATHTLWSVETNGDIKLGSGLSPQDLTLSRSEAGTLSISDPVNGPAKLVIDTVTPSYIQNAAAASKRTPTNIVDDTDNYDSNHITVKGVVQTVDATPTVTTTIGLINDPDTCMSIESIITAKLVGGTGSARLRLVALFEGGMQVGSTISEIISSIVGLSADYDVSAGDVRIVVVGTTSTIRWTVESAYHIID